MTDTADTRPMPNPRGAFVFDSATAALVWVEDMAKVDECPFLSDAPEQVPDPEPT
jgi:hypothetical protein